MSLHLLEMNTHLCGKPLPSSRRRNHVKTVTLMTTGTGLVGFQVIGAAYFTFCFINERFSWRIQPEMIRLGF